MGTDGYGWRQGGNKDFSVGKQLDHSVFASPAFSLAGSADILVRPDHPRAAHILLQNGEFARRTGISTLTAKLERFLRAVLRSIVATRSSTGLSSTSQRIIIVRLSALGDVVLAQSAVAALRRFAPKAEITWVIEERFRAIADAVPNIRVIAIPKPESLGDYFRLRRLLRTEEYDVLLAMQASFRVNLLYGAIRARRKIGFDPRRARDLQQVFMGELIHQRDEHLLDGFFQFVNKVGVPMVKTPSWPSAAGLAAEEPWWRDQLRALQKLTAESARKTPLLVAIQTGASKAERCWPAAKYAELGALFATRPDLTVVLIGGASPTERAAADAFRGAFPATLDLTGQTTLAQLQLLLSKVSVVISPDTAAVHIARAANVPVVGLYAVARPQLSGPYRKLDYTIDRYDEAVRQIAGLDPANKKKADWHFRVHDARAMELISAEEVWAATQRALKA